jgi:hypothetical protein
VALSRLGRLYSLETGDARACILCPKASKSRFQIQVARARTATKKQDWRTTTDRVRCKVVVSCKPNYALDGLECIAPAKRVEIVFEESIASFLEAAGQGDLIRLTLEIKLNGGYK